MKYSALREISVESHMHYELSNVPLHTIPLMLRIIMIGKWWWIWWDIQNDQWMWIMIIITSDQQNITIY